MSDSDPRVARFQDFPVHADPFLTPIIGRMDEIELVTRLLGQDRRRLVTITGPGGIGKTRLAWHLASVLKSSFVDGVHLVPLASVTTVDLVMPAIARSLGISVPNDGTFAHDQLERWLAPMETLLVLDNLEQVITVGPNLFDLLARAPNVSILTTSQAPLGLSIEQIVPLSPLSLPEHSVTPDLIGNAEAVQLFVAHARHRNPTFALTQQNAIAIATLCHRLDGLPLAIELAAARSSILSPEAILSRLTEQLSLLASDRHGIVERHRTMRQTIAWSYDLLNTDEQQLLRVLAVFTGGISFEAIESLPDADVSTMDTLHRLVDRHLVQAIPLQTGEVRFRMLGVIRAYCRELSQVYGETDVNHCAHALAIQQLAQTAAPHLLSSQQDAWNDRLEREWENIQAAIIWSLTHHPEIALRIAGSIWRFCDVRGHVGEGFDWLGKAISAVETVASDREPTRLDLLSARVGAGYLAEGMNQIPQAGAWLQQSLVEARAFGDIDHEIESLIGLGLVNITRGAFPEAVDVLETAISVATAHRKARWEAIARNTRAGVFYYQGDFTQASESFERARHLAEEVGDRRLEAGYLNNLAAAATSTNDLDRAEEYSSRALLLARSLNDRHIQSMVMMVLGEISLARGDLSLAESRLTEALALYQLDDDRDHEAFVFILLASVAIEREEPRNAIAHVRSALTRVRQIGKLYALIVAIERLVRVACMLERWQETMDLFTAADALRASLNYPRDREDSEMMAKVTATLTRHAPQDMRPAGPETFDLATGLELAETIAARLAGLPAPRKRTEQAAYGLTRRERDVLGLLVDGESTQQIADILSISPRTATTHIGNIFAKLDVSNRTSAVIAAMRLGIL